ncbi:MAG: hypothetical protein ABR953_15010 [Candidatus Acidiferrales bacterium]|jgi:hypothetical protein
MTPKTAFNLAGATREECCNLYLQSLGNPETRRMHPLIPTGTITVEDLKIDFKTWYGGVLALARAIDPDVGSPLPKYGELEQVISKSTFVDQVRGAIEKAA